MYEAMDPAYVIIDWKGYGAGKQAVNVWVLPLNLTSVNLLALAPNCPQDVYVVANNDLAHALCGALTSQFQVSTATGNTDDGLSLVS